MAATTKPPMLLRKVRPGSQDARAHNTSVGIRLQLAQQHALPGTNASDAIRMMNTILPATRLLHYPTYASWLNGNRTLSAKQADELGHMFDVDPIWILYGGGNLRTYPVSRLKGNERFVAF